MRAVDDVKSKLREVGDAARDAGGESEGAFGGFFESLKGGLSSPLAGDTGPPSWRVFVFLGFAFSVSAPI
jgi:hypothetical protein